MEPRALSSQSVQAAEERLGYTFQDKESVVRAFSHASVHNEGFRTNERLEFLGDSVLDLIVSVQLFGSMPEADEGELSQRRASFTSGPALSELSRRLGLGELLRTGKGQDLEPTLKMEEDLVEACVGAIYLDGGLQAAQEFVLRHLMNSTPPPDVTQANDPKSRLQHYTLGQRLGLPEYRLVDVTGPGHSLKFTMEVWVDGTRRGVGASTSKKLAAMEAATAALDELEAARTAESGSEG